MSNTGSLELTFSIKFRGGEAESNLVDFYDGSDSLFGFARAMMLTTHYLLNNKVSFSAPATKGVKLYMVTSRQGSFDQIVSMVIENPGTIACGIVTGRAVWDFTKFIFS